MNYVLGSGNAVLFTGSYDECLDFIIEAGYQRVGCRIVDSI